MIRSRARVVACLVSVAGCGGEDGSYIGPTTPVKVMTRNLYLGADLTVVGDAMSREEIPVRVARLWADIQASDFPARAKLLADEIANARPDLVGLQEVERVRTQTPSDFSFDAPPVANASTDALDFLSLMLDELAARGARYLVAVEAIHGDAELPAATSSGALMDLRLTDRDVVLARAGLATRDPTAGNFLVRIPLRIGGPMGVAGSLVRGYGRVGVTLEGGATFTFVNTHLEVGGPAARFQEAQAAELVKLLEGVAGQVVLVGDFNSPADGSGSASYGSIARSYTDAWPKTSADPGYTCCIDLRSPGFTARQRIDIVFFRGRVRAESAEVVGTDPGKRTPSGLWPSDHAGVIAVLGIAP